MSEPQMDPETLERIGLLRDRAENGIAAAMLPLRPEIHAEGLLGILRKIHAELADIFTSHGGDE